MGIVNFNTLTGFSLLRWPVCWSGHFPRVLQVLPGHGLLSRRQTITSAQYFKIFNPDNSSGKDKKNLKTGYLSLIMSVYTLVGM